MMLRKLRPRSVYDVMAAIACFGVLAGGTAYAAATVTGADVVDESLTGADVKGKQGTSTTPAVNGTLGTQDVGGQPANAQNGTPFIDGALTQWDIKNGTLGGDDMANGSLTGADVANDSLTGADIQEGSLSTVPAAYDADHAILADSATSAVRAPVEGYVALSGNANSGNQVAGSLDTRVDCPSGTRPLGGGGYGRNSSFTTGENVAVIDSEPAVFIHPQTGVIYPYGWYVRVKNNTPNTSLSVAAWVVCANTDLAGSP